VADIIMNNLRRKKVIVIKNCVECPFSRVEFGDVFCTGIGKDKHFYIALAAQALEEGIPAECCLPDQAFIKDA